MRRAITCAFLALLVVSAYRQSLGVPFVLDDARWIVGNPTIRTPSLGSLLANPRPVLSASLALNHAVGGFDVGGYHVVNLVAHLLCGILVFGLARFTFQLPCLISHAGAADGLALASSGIFLLHPVQTETVTYVIQRGESFATAAVIALVWMGARAARATRPGQLLIGMAVVGALGILSKPVAAGSVLVFAAYDACLLGTSWWRPQRRPMVYATLATVGGAGALWAARWSSQSAGFHVAGLSPWEYARWQPAVILDYVRVLVWPDRLCFDCGLRTPWPIVDSWLGRAPLAAAAVLAAATVVAIAARRRAPLAAFAVLGTLASLMPTSSIVPLADVWVEHRLYLAVAWWAMLVAGTGDTLLARARARDLLSPSASRALATACVAVLWVVLAAATMARNRVWTDEVTLWRDSIAKAPRNARLHYNLGTALAARNDGVGAIASLREATRLDPAPAMAWINLGNELLRSGDVGGAVDALRAGLARDPSLAFVHRNLAVALIRLERGDEAAAELTTAVTMDPRDRLSQRLLGDLSFALGRPEDARRAYTEVLRLDPTDAHARERLNALGGQP